MQRGMIQAPLKFYFALLNFHNIKNTFSFLILLTKQWKISSCTQKIRFIGIFKTSMHDKFYWFFQNKNQKIKQIYLHFQNSNFKKNKPIGFF